MMSIPQHKRIPTSGENDVLIEQRAAFTERHSARMIVGIKAAITSYYLDLDARKHGGVAMDHAFNKIEHMLGMSWANHKGEIAPKE